MTITFEDIASGAKIVVDDWVGPIPLEKERIEVIDQAEHIKGYVVGVSTLIVLGDEPYMGTTITVEGKSDG